MVRGLAQALLLTPCVITGECPALSGPLTKPGAWAEELLCASQLGPSGAFHSCWLSSPPSALTGPRGEPPDLLAGDGWWLSLLPAPARPF